MDAVLFPGYQLALTTTQVMAPVGVPFALARTAVI